MTRKVFINVPGIKNTFLRRFVALPLTLAVLLVLIIGYMVFNGTRTAIGGSLLWLVYQLGILITLLNDIRKSILLTWKGK